MDVWSRSCLVSQLSGFSRGGAALWRLAAAGMEAREYGGSRREARRFEYSENSGAGFVELSRDHVMTGEHFFPALQSVPGVTRVELAPSKSANGNPGDHYMERNVYVYVTRYGNAPMECELTRYNHVKVGAPYPLHGDGVLQGAPQGLAHGGVAHPHDRRGGERADAQARSGVLLQISG